MGATISSRIIGPSRFLHRPTAEAMNVSRFSAVSYIHDSDGNALT